MSKRLNPSAPVFIPRIYNKLSTDKSWDALPFDMFMDVMIDFLTFIDVCRLCQVSKLFHSYYSEPLIWKKFYIQECVRLFYPKRLHSIMEWCSAKNLKREKVKLPLVIENNSDIPYNIYWIKQTPIFTNNYNINHDIVNEYRKMGQINPGNVHVIRTCENHHWICIPTIEWLLKNPYYNVGFGFHIDINCLEDYKHIKKIKPCSNESCKNCNNIISVNKLTYVKRIHQSTNLKQCLFCFKNQNVENYKQMFIGCVIKKKDFTNKINHIKEFNKDLKKNIKMCKRQIKIQENKLKKNIQTRESLEYALSVCENY